jgi:hypothetical protein
MTITICGSTAFIDEMLDLKRQLEALGHVAKTPPDQVPGPDGKLMYTRDYYKLKKDSHQDDKSWIWQDHSQRLYDHFDKVESADAILVANYDKNGIKNYIGANTLMEMGLAFHLRKPIYLLNPIPEISYKEEILGMKPIVINNDLTNIPNN